MDFKPKAKKNLSRRVSDFSRFLHEQRHFYGTNAFRQTRKLENRLAYEFKVKCNLEITNEELNSDMELFATEMFSRMYEDSDISETVDKQWAEDIHEILDAQSEFQSIKRMARRDPDLASLATAYTFNHFKEEICSVITYRKQEEQENKKKEQEREQGQEKSKGKGQDQEQKEKGENSQDKAVSKLPESLKNEFLSKAMDFSESVEEIGELKEAMSGIGSLGSTKELSTERTELINSLTTNGSLKNILKMVGRLKKLMNSFPALVKSKRKEKIYEIEQDRAPKELSRERMLAANDDTFDQYCFRFATRKQWKKKKGNGQDESGLGPILMCIDTSGSMHGERIELAVALAIATASIASDTKREFKAVTFNKKLGHEFYIPKKARNSDVLTVLKMISKLGASGGTSFNPPVKWAVDQALKHPKSDILFLTDGTGSCSTKMSSMLEFAKKKRGLRLFTVLIGEDDYPHAGGIEEISDGVINVKELTENKSINELARLMKSIKTRKL